MAKDVRIIPADGDIQFYNAAASASGKIQQVNDDLVISNAVGDILFGDTDSDVYIGDGVSNVDIIFEQDGEIRGEAGSNVNLTLGSKDTVIYVTGSTVALQKDGGNVGIGTTSPGYTVDVVGNVNASGEVRSTYGKFNRINNRPNGNPAIEFSSTDNITFYSASAAIARFTGGRLGIGTTTPTSKLHVNGGTDITGSLFLSRTATYNSQWHIFTSHQSTANYGSLYFTPSLTTSNYYFRNSANVDLFFISSSGNVGIGTASPASRLHTTVDFSVSTTDYTAGTAGSRLLLKPYASTGDTYSLIQAQDAGGVSNNALVLQPYGDNVGIGTTSPTRTLEIGTDGGGEKILKIHSDTASSYFEIQSLGNVARLLTTNNTNLLLQSDGSGGYITFNANSAERMRIAPSGNVGIGTTTPSTKLHVSGSIRTHTTSTSRYIELTGGTTGNFIDTFGTTLYIRYGGDTSKSIVLNSGGQVGIGTTAPSEKLTVSGSIDIISNDSRLLFGGNRAIEGTQNGSFLTIGEGYGSTIIKNGVTLQGDLVVDGSVTAQEFHTEFVSASIIYQSGSTKFGDTSDDLHDFTGSLRVLGDLKVDQGLTINVNSGQGELGMLYDSQRLFLYGGSNRSTTNGAYIQLDGNNFGGTNAGGDLKLYAGNESGADIVFNTGATDRVVITNGGNVGIGTTTPTQRLTVEGNISASGNFYLDGIIETDEIRSRTYPTYNILNLEDDNVNNTNGVSLLSVSSMVFGLDANNNSTSDYFEWRTDASAANTGTAIMTLTDEGNLGIGTTSPDTELHVSAGDAIITAEGSSSSYINGAIQLISNHASSLRGLGTFHYVAHTDVEWFAGLPYNDNDAFVINRNTNYTTPSSQTVPPGKGASEGRLLTLDSTGRLGIGTSVPAAELDVNGDIKLSADSSIFSDGSITMGIDYNNNQTDRVFKVVANNSTEVFRVQENGNVGIGTTVPTQALTVEGNISGSGRLYLGTVDSNTTSTTALVLNGSEVEQRSLGNAAFQDTGSMTVSSADSVNGIQTTSFLRSDTSDTFTNGTLSFSAGTNFDGSQANTTNSYSIASKFLANPASEAGEWADVRILNNLAGAHKWATITLTDCYQSDRTTAVTALNANAFDGTSANHQLYQNAAGDPMVIQIDLPFTINFSAWVGIVFGNPSWRTKSVKIETFRNGAWQTECDLTNQSSHIVARQVANNDSNGVTKIRYTLDDLQNTTNHYIRIVSLFNLHYRTGAESYGGVHYIDKYKDSVHYGHLRPATDSTYDLGSTSLYYRAMYSDKIYLNALDTNTTSTTALVLNGSEVEKRTLATGAFTTVGNSATQNTGSMTVLSADSASYAIYALTATAADTVDGLDATSFIRSDTDDTATGLVTFNGGIHVLSGTGGGKLRIKRNSGSTDGDDITDIHMDDSGILFDVDNDNDNDTGNFTFRYKTGGVFTNLLQFTTSTITYKGNAIWHSGNDGPTSGLSAQTSATASYVAGGNVVGTVGSATSATSATSASHAEYADEAGTATNADNINVDEKNDNVDYQVLFSTANGSGNQRPYIDTDNAHFLYNPSTHTLTVGTFSGNLSGNATTATNATTASYASSADYANITGTPTLGNAASQNTGSMTVLSADSATTATTATNATSASYAASVNYADIIGTPTLDNYGEWYLASEADVTDVTSGQYVKFAGGATITGAGTEGDPYLMDITPSTASYATFAVNSTTASLASAVALTTTTSNGNFDVLFETSTPNKVGKDTGGDFAYNPSTDTLTVGTVNGLATTATSASHAEYADNAGLATNAGFVDVKNVTTGTEYRVVFADAEGTGYEQMNVHDDGIEYDPESGTLRVSGDVVAYNSFSDRELKDNIQTYQDGLNAVMQLNPVTYEWKKGREGQEIGLIAQEVEKVIPQVVREQKRMNEGIYKTVDYEKLVAVLIDAVQDQQKQIDELKQKLDGITS